MTFPPIELESVRVVRGRRELLAIDRMAVAEGSVLAVLGPNGAGKSTLLKCLVGAIRPAAGAVRVLGRDVGRLGGASLARLRRRVGYLAQLLAPESEMPLTVREVVAVGRTGRAGLFRPLTSRDWQLVDGWIARLGLAGLARQPYRVLSGGEQRKALLAMAMVQEPEILLLDEPTANLDAYWREQIVAAMSDLRRERRLTIVLVCHDLETIPPCAAQAVVLQRGRVVAQGACEDVLTQDRIASLYGPGLTMLRQGRRYVLAPGSSEGPP